MIDLGKEVKDYGGDMPVPESPEKAVKMKTVYPSVYICGKKELLTLPDTGEATIKFKVVSREVSSRKSGEKEPKERFEVELEIHAIEPKATPKKEKSTEEALDTLLKLVGG